MQGGGGAALLGLRVVSLAVIAARMKTWEAVPTALNSLDAVRRLDALSRLVGQRIQAVCFVCDGGLT